MKSAWIEVFKAGTHTSANGVTKTYTEADLVAIAKRYNEQDAHEAPFVLGHPDTDDPAYGWIKTLKVAGEKLMAFVDQISDGIVDAVRRGEYKRISIALYPDNLLRHVGLLGATPPAVKGLTPVQFSDSEFDEFAWATDEYRMPIVGRLMAGIRDFFIDKFGLEVADKVIDKDAIARLQGDAMGTWIPDEAPANYADQKEEQDMEALKLKVETLERVVSEQGQRFTEALAELAEIRADRAKIIQDAATQAEADAAKAKTLAFEAAKAGFVTFCEGLVAAGKVLAAEKDDLVDEYADLLRFEEGMTFSENVVIPSAKMKARLEKRQVAHKPATPFATFGRVKDAEKLDEVPVQFADMKKTIDPMGVQIDKEIREFADKHKLTYEEAAAKYCAA